MKTLTATWTGLRPMLIHNAQTADPTNEFARAIKVLTAKKAKKTEADCEEINRLSYLSAFYLSENGKPCIPSDNIERCIQQGAQKKRLGKDFAAAAFCTEAEYEIQYTGPKDPAKMFKDPKFVHKKTVVVGNARVMRFRPMIPAGWKITFTMEFDETVMNKADIVRAMEDAGSLVGLGNWRPKYGRFEVAIA